MKTFVYFLPLFVLYGNAFSKKAEFAESKESNSSELTPEEIAHDVFNGLMKAQVFSAGTLLGLLVACLVVVTGSFLVLWRLCCDVEMVVTREAMQPLHSISQKVSASPKSPTNRTVSKENLLVHGCSSSTLDIV